MELHLDGQDSICIFFQCDMYEFNVVWARIAIIAIDGCILYQRCLSERLFSFQGPGWVSFPSLGANLDVLVGGNVTSISSKSSQSIF